MATAEDLKTITSTLARVYGRTPAPVHRDPYEFIVFENVAYLVDDACRARTYDALAKTIGIEPEAILGASPERLANAIAGGGMDPARRAEKLRRIAQLTLDIGGVGALRKLVQTSSMTARRTLRRFPGIGEPGADRIFLCSGVEVTLAPDSNGLRVLTRLGISPDRKTYDATYREAAAAVQSVLPNDHGWLIRAHGLLRRHGQETCKRSVPRCGACALADCCSYFASSRQ